ncbi:hypothetical protein ACFLQ2_02250 [archaeon]
MRGRNHARALLVLLLVGVAAAQCIQFTGTGVTGTEPGCFTKDFPGAGTLAVWSDEGASIDVSCLGQSGSSVTGVFGGGSCTFSVDGDGFYTINTFFAPASLALTGATCSPSEEQCINNVRWVCFGSSQGTMFLQDGSCKGTEMQCAPSGGLRCFHGDAYKCMGVPLSWNFFGGECAGSSSGDTISTTQWTSYQHGLNAKAEQHMKENEEAAAAANAEYQQEMERLAMQEAGELFDSASISDSLSGRVASALVAVLNYDDTELWRRLEQVEAAESLSSAETQDHALWVSGQQSIIRPPCSVVNKEFNDYINPSNYLRFSRMDTEAISQLVGGVAKCERVTRGFYDLKENAISKMRDEPYYDQMKHMAGFSATDRCRVMSKQNPASNFARGVANWFGTAGQFVVDTGADASTYLTGVDYQQDAIDVGQQTLAKQLNANVNPVQGIWNSLTTSAANQLWTATSFAGGAIQGFGGAIPSLVADAGDALGCVIVENVNLFEQDAADKVRYYASDLVVGLATTAWHNPAQFAGQIWGAKKSFEVMDAAAKAGSSKFNKMNIGTKDVYLKQGTFKYHIVGKHLVDFFDRYGWSESVLKSKVIETASKGELRPDLAQGGRLVKVSYFKTKKGIYKPMMVVLEADGMEVVGARPL